MKKAFFLLLALSVVWSSMAFAWSSAISGKTTVGINYMTWGTYTDLSTEAVSITTGLTTIRGFGTHVNTGESFINNSTTETDAIFAKAIAGVISIKANNNDVKDGTWWAIGR